jgi:transmembrane protein DUF3566
MTTTAEDPATDTPPSDRDIDVELPAASGSAQDASTDVRTPPPMSPPAVITPSRTSRTTPVRRGSRRTRVTVRRFGLWSVFKFALIFSFCLMVVVWLALMLVFFVLQAAGVTDTIAFWVGCVTQGAEGTKETCVATGIDGVKIFTYLFLVGLIMAAAGAVLWTFMALIYNLIADIVGGVEVVLAEKRERD